MPEDPKQNDLTTYLLTQVHGKVDQLATDLSSLTLSLQEVNIRFGEHVESDKVQFGDLQSKGTEILAKLEPLVSDDQFEKRMKTAIESSEGVRLSFWQRISAGVVAFCAVGSLAVGIAVIIVNGKVG